MITEISVGIQEESILSGHTFSLRPFSPNSVGLEVLKWQQTWIVFLLPSPALKDISLGIVIMGTVCPSQRGHTETRLELSAELICLYIPRVKA
jgi:hypothetical protein